MSYNAYNTQQYSATAAATISNDKNAMVVLKQSISDMTTLYATYRDELSPLLKEAESRLSDMGFAAPFSHMESAIQKHIKQWHTVSKGLSDTAIEYGKNVQQIYAQLQLVQTEIAERDKIINSERERFEIDQREYEQHVKTLESVIANSIPRKPYSEALDQLGLAAPVTSRGAVVVRNQPHDELLQLSQLQKDLSSSEMQFMKLKNENHRLTENMKVLRASSTDFQQALMALNNKIAEKDDELLKLRWLTQDLAQERNALEQTVQRVGNDPNYVSVTPARKDDYDQIVDELNSFMREDADDDDDGADTADYGMMALDDVDINPQVAAKLAEALEVVKKVTQSQAQKLEAPMSLTGTTTGQQQGVMDRTISMETDEEDLNDDEDGGAKKVHKQAHDDMLMGPRRASLLQFQAAFQREVNQRSGTFDYADNELQKEDIRRRRDSQRRASRINIPIGLLPPKHPLKLDIESKSAIGLSSNAQMDDADKAYLKSLAQPSRRADQHNVGGGPGGGGGGGQSRVYSQPPSPRLPNDADSGAEDAEEEDVVAMNIPMDMEMDMEVDMEVDVQQQQQLQQVEIQKSTQETQNLDYIRSLQQQLAEKQQLISDLKSAISTVSQQRRSEIERFQQQLETIQTRSRDWYQQLVSRVNEMGGEYQQNVQREFEMKEARLREECEQQVTTMREECEQYKQQWMGLRDDNYKQVLETQLEELRGALEVSQSQSRANANEENEHENAMDLEKIEMDTLRAEVESLRAERQEQDEEYEANFQEFASMAEEKVSQLEAQFADEIRSNQETIRQLQQQLEVMQVQAQNTPPPTQSETVTNTRATVLHHNRLETVTNVMSDADRAQMERLKREIFKLKNEKSNLYAENQQFGLRVDAYKASIMDLAQKLKTMNDETKVLETEVEKWERKCERLEKTKKKLRQQVSEVKEEKNNLQHVNQELVAVKQHAMSAAKDYEAQRQSYEERLQRLHNEMQFQNGQKLQTMNVYNAEMEKLRGNIRTLQVSIKQQEVQNAKLREQEKENKSVAGGWNSWWPAKK